VKRESWGEDFSEHREMQVISDSEMCSCNIKRKVNKFRENFSYNIKMGVDKFREFLLHYQNLSRQIQREVFLQHPKESYQNQRKVLLQHQNEVFKFREMKVNKFREVLLQYDTKIKVTNSEKRSPAISI
jgi:hypothetical protein